MQHETTLQSVIDGLWDASGTGFAAHIARDQFAAEPHGYSATVFLKGGAPIVGRGRTTDEAIEELAAKLRAKKLVKAP